MLHENRNENLPMERDNSSNINENKSDEEEKMTSLSSLSIDQKSLKENRKRKLNDEIVKQQEEEEETQRLNYENLSDNEIKERLLKTIIYDFFLRIKVNQCRQKVLIQRFEFEDHFNQLLPHNTDDDDDDDGDDHNNNDNYHENNRGNSNQKDVDQQSLQKYQYDPLK
ncbi:unnamed protein product [Rotaria sp. Silwood1]|nr:unnamed protein product [Rotaria sp. Silwood1]